MKDEFVESQASGDRKKPTKMAFRKGLIAGLTVSCLGVALGLGLGLGLRKSGGFRCSRGNWLEKPCISAAGPTCPAGYSKPPVLLISLDGFKAEYLLRDITPTIGRMARCGVHAPYMYAQFPTVTFPNHYTIVTGLYGESNGIAENNMYDPVFNTSFCLGCNESFVPAWWGGEPLWNTVQKQGKRSGTFFWPGSDVSVDGMYPDYYRRYDGSVPYEDRVNQVLEWLDLPENTRPSFMTLYFSAVDTTGHIYGPDSKEIREALKEIDCTMAQLMDGLAERDLLGCINIITVADHGMADTSCDRVVRLDKLTDTNEMHIYSGSVGRIRPLRPDIDNTFDPIAVADSLTCSSPHMTVYNKRDLPKRFHFANNRRIEDVIISVEDKWLVARGAEDHYATERCAGGTHGYDNEYRSMHALFVAHGPAFKQNTESPPFQNIELYDLMADLVGVTPAPNNGTRGSLNHILRQPPPVPSEPPPAPAGSCPFPTDYAAASQNQDCTSAPGSSCTGFANSATVEDFDRELDLTAAQESTYQSQHLPFGAPSVTFVTGYCHLTQKDYVAAYNRDTFMPLWSATTLSGDTQMSSGEVTSLCRRHDVRVPAGDSLNCTEFGDLDIGHLYSPYQKTGDESSWMSALVTSNMVPQYRSFSSTLWRPVEEKVSGWAGTYGGVNVISGPIFDWNLDGNRDDRGTNHTQYLPNTPAPIPTHYYKIVTRCSDGGDITSACQGGKADVISFILPHRDRYLSVERGCQDSNSLMQTHVARVRDIELLTGLRFFPSLDTDQALQLRLFLPTQLWD
ncbi:PREDICTED: venom phosphodiesterase 2-like [Branchiostoma belcheri]|uniref:Venom phosphodiesterase 2-like n=1 Tax=Branchiostoma belcheri TaxID=7741 RepID=A0A6P4YEZ4_BRABE|nr:PREDICTED: venom phosphodiesterase 2-like [Branchiostoma belcheri]XP_019615526.1 PREDICTED: venom phosphodiesterase 2-like [Branchiostoma belcheri]